MSDCDHLVEAERHLHAVLAGSERYAIGITAAIQLIERHQGHCHRHKENTHAR